MQAGRIQVAIQLVVGRAFQSVLFFYGIVPQQSNQAHRIRRRQRAPQMRDVERGRAGPNIAKHINVILEVHADTLKNDVAAGRIDELCAVCR